MKYFIYNRVNVKYNDMNPNNYENQKLRGLKRKYEAVLARGGKCERCGYDKNIAALDFHHINPDEKEFQIDMRHFSNHSLEKLQAELDKCILLCANCHRIEHHVLEHGTHKERKEHVERLFKINGLNWRDPNHDAFYAPMCDIRKWNKIEI